MEGVYACLLPLQNCVPNAEILSTAQRYGNSNTAAGAGGCGCIAIGIGIGIGVGVAAIAISLSAYLLQREG